jgi:hypothetical protein
MWYDASQSVGGFFRIGHEPNYEGGRSQIMSNIFSPEGVYHRSCHMPLEPRHRFKNGFASGDDTLRYEFDGRIRWTLKDTDIEMELEVEPYVPAIDAHKREGGQNAEGYTGAHVDTACGVSGCVTVKGRTYVIADASGYRDHGWGPRGWTTLVSHRAVIGVFDRENSFIAMTFLMSDDKLVRFGWVIRGKQVIFADKVDIRAIIGVDGATNHGGTARLRLTTGEVIDATFEPCYPAIASWIHDTVFYDSLSRATWGDKVGFGLFETTCNLQRGTWWPTVYEGSIGLDGWHDVEPLLTPYLTCMRKENT